MSGTRTMTREAGRGLLTARPTPVAKEGPNARGIAALGLGSGRDAVLYVPKSYDPAGPVQEH